jgi:hypothetical protein
MAQARERNNQSRSAKDAEMLDAGTRVTKQNQKTSGGRERRWKLAEQLEDENDPVCLLSKILDTQVNNLKVRELIGCSPALHKLLLRSLDESDAPVERNTGDW